MGMREMLVMMSAAYFTGSFISSRIWSLLYTRQAILSSLASNLLTSILRRQARWPLSHMKCRRDD